MSTTRPVSAPPVGRPSPTVQRVPAAAPPVAPPARGPVPQPASDVTGSQSLVTSLDDTDLTRPLLLALAALGVLLLGARTGLQAPLAVGGGVLAVDALQLLAPYAAALPRWMSLGVAGVLLVVVGATYEQRRREVARLRDRYDALA